MALGVRVPILLQKCSFAGIVFPVESVDVVGGIRDHIHEYPHAPGGAPEKLGRKLYIVKIKAKFLTALDKYPGLWPVSLRKLRVLWENQTTDDLVVPTIGTIKAYCRNWTQQQTNKISNGEMVDLEMVEDQSQLALTQSLISVTGQNLTTVVALFNAQYALMLFASQSDQGLFAALQNAANAVLAIGDLSQVATNLVVLKLQAVVDLFTVADKALSMQNPMNAVAIDAIHAMMDAVQQQLQNVLKKPTAPQTYFVPAPMAMSAISATLYGDTSHVIELMQLNAVDDVFRIPAGTQLRFYPPT